jgi:hypothetical protein
LSVVRGPLSIVSRKHGARRKGPKGFASPEATSLEARKAEGTLTPGTCDLNESREVG